MNNFIASLVAVGFVALGCGSDGSSTDAVGGDLGPVACADCATKPEAVAADDGRPTGVYKGVIYGGTWSGTVKATIATNQSVGTCDIKTAGKTYSSGNFTSSLTSALTSADDQTGNTSHTFSGTDFTFVLVLDGSGNVVSSEVTLSGDAVGVSMAKESSTLLVECFEGTWLNLTDQDTGIWNLVLYGTQLLGGATAPPSQGGWGIVTGTLDGLEIIVDNPPGSGRSASGKLSEDGSTMSGTWAWPDAHGTWNGHRTL